MGRASGGSPELATTRTPTRAAARKASRSFGLAGRRHEVDRSRPTDLSAISMDPRRHAHGRGGRSGGPVLGTEALPVTAAGYRAALAWMRRHGELAKVGVEGTGSSGARPKSHDGANVA